MLRTLSKIKPINLLKFKFQIKQQHQQKPQAAEVKEALRGHKPGKKKKKKARSRQNTKKDGLKSKMCGKLISVLW